MQRRGGKRIRMDDPCPPEYEIPIAMESNYMQNQGM